MVAFGEGVWMCTLIIFQARLGSTMIMFQARLGNTMIIFQAVERYYFGSQVGLFRCLMRGSSCREALLR
jgi:hypothetical protein